MRLIRFRLFAGLLLICGPVSSSARCEDFTAINERVRASIVEILISGINASNKDVTSSGTGFIAHADPALPYSFIFTAAHVIGNDADWLLDDNNKPVKRKISVKQSEGIITKWIGDAEVLGIDHEADVAVLTIPKREINPIPAAGFLHLKQLEMLMVSGFPATEDKKVAVYASVRDIDYSRSRIEIDKTLLPGQSGGPIIDRHGWAVGIVSENNDKLDQKFHRAAVVSAAASLLNSYLNKRGGSPLILKSISSGNALSVFSRNGRAKIQISGKTGELARDLQSEKTLADVPAAELNLSGEERSECEEASGRTRSSAWARASVQPFENNGLKIPISLAVQGGHYRTAVMCLAGKPIGLTDHDTAAYASVVVDGQIDFDLQTAPTDLRVVWQDMPPGTRLAVVGDDGNVRTQIEAQQSSEQVITLNESGMWHLRVNISRHLGPAGGSERDQYNKQSIVFVAPH
jgi:hypothetical protein